MKVSLYLDDTEYSKELEDFVLKIINKAKIKENITVNIIDKEKNFSKLLPAVVLESKGSKIIYNAIPKNREEKSFLKTLKMLYSGKVELKRDVADRVKKIDRKMKVEVFITITCPYCPKIVEKINSFAVLNPNVLPVIIDAEYFTEYSSEKGVSSVPHIIIDEKINIVGNTSEDELSIRLIEAKYLF